MTEIVSDCESCFRLGRVGFYNNLEELFVTFVIVFGK